MFRKILIANRGEIALRVIDACKELGIATVAVYSEADRNSLHVRFADEAVCIGPPRSSESYLNIPQVISAAEITNVDAIHPGYGFLSENANFAEVCEASHISFIGPSPDMLRMMGEKDQARREMAAAGVPVVPGSDGIVQDEAAALSEAERIKYPVIVKASAGGGGRGMRIVRSAEELPVAFGTARNEAQQAFGTPDVYLEKFIERPRHIEFQVLADEHGHVMHLGERECSIQRRHQKLIEESPSPALDDRKRAELGARVVEALEELKYSSAGTVEFLMDEDGSVYFIEMNARIQVEHPVTEMVTGVDLIKSQIRLATGEKLEDVVGKPVFRGHAIECRINAEDPETFVPSAGRITVFRVPGGPGIRVDTAAHADGVIPPYYDSLVAKLIAHGDTRAEAIARMRRALEMFVIEGIKTSIPLHRKILAEADFAEGRLDTHFLTDSQLSPQDNIVFPRLYAIIDSELITTSELVLAKTLAGSGVELLQYRAKKSPVRKIYEISRQLSEEFAQHGLRFIVNDRPDIALLAGAGGVHVGQDDLGVEEARAICGQDRWVGVSTHTLDQVAVADRTSADYIAFGPIFTTTTKQNPDAVVGTDLLRRARQLTYKPLVAIGGITCERAGEVYAAGADSLAVARDLICATDPGKRAREYLEVAASAKPRNSR